MKLYLVRGPLSNGSDWHVYKSRKDAKLACKNLHKRPHGVECIEIAACKIPLEFKSIGCWQPTVLNLWVGG